MSESEDKVEDTAQSDENEKTAESEELTQLEKQAAILEEKKKILDLYKKMAEALPKGETKPLAGEIKVDEKFGFTAQLVAYEAMKKISEKIVGKIDEQNLSSEKDSERPKILIVDSLSLDPDDLPLIQVESIFTNFEKNLTDQELINSRLKETLEKELPEIPAKSALEAELEETFGKDEHILEFAPALALAPAAISGIVSSIADIMGFFREDFEVKGKEFTLGQEGIIANIAGSIAENEKCEIQIFNFNWIRESKILERFTKLLESKHKLKMSIDNLKTSKDRLTKQIDIMKQIQELAIKLGQLKSNTDNSSTAIAGQLTTLTQPLDRFNVLLKKADSAIANSELLEKAISDFVTSATTPSDEKPCLLLKAAARKHLKTAKVSHLLYLKILSSGGEAITRKKIFGSFGDTAFIGGTAVSYILAETSGKIILAETLTGLARREYNLSSSELTKARYYGFETTEGTG
ncbi:MAG: hypothetical protein ACFFB3_18060 [Candidatus Hodarchaeota archaeon]